MSPEIKAKKEALPYNAQQRVQAVVLRWRSAMLCAPRAIAFSTVAYGTRRQWQTRFASVSPPPLRASRP